MHPFPQWFRKQLFHKYISIRTKLLFSVFIVIGLFGAMATWMSYYYITETAKLDLSRKASFFTNLLDNQLTPQILLNDIVSVNSIISHFISDAPEILYIVVYDKNKNIIGHTFEGDSIPVFITPPSGNDSVMLFLDRPHHIRIRQQTVSLSNGTIGFVKVGLDETTVFNKGRKIATIIAGLLILLLIPASIITISFSYLITYPIHEILKCLKKFMPGESPPKPKIIFNDEIALLSNSIQEMMHRVSIMTDESKKNHLKFIETEKHASVGILASGIAHEINNPIAGIEICAYRLERDSNLSIKNREYVQLILEAARHIQSVVKNLLNYARQPDLKETSLDLRATISVAEKLVQYRLKKNNIIFEMICQPFPCIITGIKAQIIQVLVNGLLNAIDAIEKNGNIIVRLTEQNASFILRIEDSGKGLDTEVKSKAFDPFFTTKGTLGTGLGLYVSYNIIQSHNGRIDLAPLPGKGACLEITLPKGENR